MFASEHCSTINGHLVCVRSYFVEKKYYGIGGFPEPYWREKKRDKANCFIPPVFWEGNKNEK